MQLDKMMNSEVYRGSRQQPNRKIVKETVFPIRAKSALGHHDDKLESTSSATQSYGDLRHGRRGHADIGIMGRSKVLGSNQQPSLKAQQERKDDELVKYMSNLPGYLQHVEREVQDKFLNFGVLDWARLKKWKEKQKFVPAMDGYNASASSSHLAAKSTQRSSKPRTAEHREVVNRQNEQHCPCSRPNTSSGDCLLRDAKPSIRNMMQFQDLEAASSSGLNGQKKLQSTHKQSAKNYSVPIVGKGNRQDFDHKIDSSKLKSRPDVSTTIRQNDDDDFYDSQFKKRLESKKELGVKKKDLHPDVTSNMGFVSTGMRNYDMFPSFKGKKNAYGAEPTKITEKLQGSAVDISSYCQGGDKKNIILLVPTKSSRNSSSECSSTSFSENSTEADRDSSSDCLTFGESHISEHESRIPYSCPLPSGSNTNTEPQSIATKSSQGMVLSSDTPQKHVRVRRMLVMPSASDGIKTLNQNAEPSKVMDQETAELVIKNGRHPSPNRRFSFSFGRMTRSFSFKESSGGPELSSTDSSMQSGPVTTKSWSFPDSNREKASGNSRRSSPLKRILEPLLKSKSTKPQHSAGSDRPLERSLKSVSFKPSQAFDSHIGNHGKSRIQALMHHVVANGQPVFRFVVDNNRTIMATIKSSASPKEDFKCNFTFYSVDEIHKKSGNWIYQGSREKSVSNVYNVIGHMKVSTLPDTTGQNSTGESRAKECVLYGVELRQADKSSPVFVPGGELAALVLTSPGNDVEFGNGLSDCLPEHGKYCDEVTAILPGAIHSLPRKGAPSPLIQRWKTGGLCDCGGWDIGCKLQILKNRRQSSKTSRTFTAYPKQECFELFVQGESQQEEAILSLCPIEKGLYSIEFSRSISLLQAFFISVTVTSFQMSSDLPQLSNLRKEQTLQERKKAMKKIPDNVLQEPILKYTQGPPLSPVGRV